MHDSLQVAVSEAPPKRLLLDKMHATGAPDNGMARRLPRLFVEG